MVDPIPNSGQAPWLYNRDGFTPFDNMDSLDRLELEIIMQESGVPSQGYPIAVPTLAPPGDSGMVGGSNPDLTKAQIAELQKALPKCKIQSNPTK